MNQPTHSDLIKKKKAIKRFMSSFTKCPTKGCWLWNKKIHRGYAGFSYYRDKRNGSAPIYGHRFSYKIFVGDYEDKLELDHLCEVKHCVNPLHLEPVTHKENMHRWMIKKGRMKVNDNAT